ncbi:MAG TPA: THUMP domain-containing protein, partial [Candidatus Nanoarchaeia archaeon]|nr:THUMP domain-containing protein [Candidatus Nanoarchaeia archaeon]
MYIATCVDGMEEICEREVDGRKAWKGRVEFEGEVKKFNSVKNIYDLWKGFKFSSQKDIIAQAKTINNEIAGTFKVVANREGEHNFSSMEIERSVGEVFHEKGFKVDLKKPRSIVFVDIKDEMCFIGLLKEFELNKRKYRFKRITPNLDCTIAYGMMKLADIKDDEIIFNPHCKDG